MNKSQLMNSFTWKETLADSRPVFRRKKVDFFSNGQIECHTKNGIYYISISFLPKSLIKVRLSLRLMSCYAKNYAFCFFVIVVKKEALDRKSEKG
jgi:hypothetical protein